MMTSKESLTLCSLLFETKPNYEENLQTLLSLVEKTSKNSFILAHEVSLTGFDYTNMEKALAFSVNATKALLHASSERCIITSMLENIDGKVFNLVKVFYKGKVVHQRAKARLFRLGKEHKYMSEGVDEPVEIIKVAGVKIAFLICFELRFKELWKRCEGADIIFIPSWWGKPRAKHFRLLTQTLAIMNECYVIASDGKNRDCTALSAIITPQGEAHYNGNKPCLERVYDKKEITKMRRYLNIGIE